MQRVVVADGQWWVSFSILVISGGHPPPVPSIGPLCIPLLLSGGQAGEVPRMEEGRCLGELLQSKEGMGYQM